MKPNALLFLFLTFGVSLPTLGNAQSNPFKQSVTQATDSTVIVAAAKQFRAGKFKGAIWGKHYREEWAVEIEVPVLDLDREKGGLTPIKLGGGNQTRSLRLEGGDGKQYVIRSISKDASKILSEELRNTVAAKVLNDQISASHPFGAVCIPKIAKALGVLHTNPKLVYVPAHPRLGEFNGVVDSMLALFEERPKGDHSTNPDFGFAKKIISTPELLSAVKKRNRNRVHAWSYVRTRLLDYLLGDWDRHEDQFRWVQYQTGKHSKSFVPIPRDRDQVFFNFDGFIPWIAGRRFALPWMQLYTPKMGFIPALNITSVEMDHLFAGELTEKDWVAIADSMKNTLTDEICEAAIKDMPKEAFAISGEKITQNLKGRRDYLPEIARIYYRHISKIVEVVGSNEQELFKVERLAGGQTRVRMYRLNEKGNEDGKLFDRIYEPSETKEIRLFGMGGKDIFKIEGDAKSGILVKLIGGKGKDKLDDKSRIAGGRPRVIYYDDKGENKIDRGPDTRVRLSDDPENNRFRYLQDSPILQDSLDPEERFPYHRAFKFNVIAPHTFIGFNPDDKTFVGAGLRMMFHGFRRRPFAHTHNISANYASGNKSFNLIYRGEFTRLIGKTDLHLDFRVNVPQFVDNFFGYGNETQTGDANLDYNFVRIKRVSLTPSLARKFGEHHSLKLGPEFLYLQAKGAFSAAEASFLRDSTSGIEARDTTGRMFLGLAIDYENDHRDHKVIPTRGYLFKLQAKAYLDLNTTGDYFSSIKSEFSTYFTLNRAKALQTTLALRIGGSASFGDYPFFKAATLGGLSNLRGTRRSRFSGDYAAYLNTELRIRLANIPTYLVPIQIGVVGLADHGRVWVKGENSNKIHGAYGGGIWLSPLNALVIQATYAVASYNEEALLVSFSFLF